MIMIEIDDFIANMLLNIDEQCGIDDVCFVYNNNAV